MITTTADQDGDWEILDSETGDRFRVAWMGGDHAAYVLTGSEGFHLSAHLCMETARRLVELVGRRGQARDTDGGGQWTPDDLPSEVEKHGAPGDWWDLTVSERRDLAVWLNSHHPKPDGVAVSMLEAERDEAVGRAEMQARICEQLRSLIKGQKANVTKAQRERDEADRRTAEAEADRDRWKLHHDRVDGQWAKAEREVTKLRRELIGETERVAELLSENTQLRDKVSGIAPVVSRDDVEKVLREHFAAVYFDDITAVHELLGGVDRAVLVVRESEVEAVEVEHSPGINWKANGTGIPEWWSAEQVRELRDGFAEDWIEIEAIRRAIEAEQSEDQVEAEPRIDWRQVHDTIQVLRSQGESWAEVGKQVESIWGLDRAEDQKAEQAAPLVVAKVATRYPENYRLINAEDCSEWRMTRDGSWVAADSVGQEASSDE